MGARHQVNLDGWTSGEDVCERLIAFPNIVRDDANQLFVPEAARPDL